MVLSPAFLGAEPNEVDEGPKAGLKLFQDEELIALELMRSLPSALRVQARIYDDMEDPAMPPGRLHPADGRHLSGCSQDNRIIPYEGAPANQFTPAQRKRLLDLIGTYLEYLPSGSFLARMSAIEEYLSETRFCWIGGFSEDSPFYYRIQSPIVIIEFDHHSGIFLKTLIPLNFIFTQSFARRMATITGWNWYVSIASASRSNCRSPTNERKIDQGGSL